MVDQSRLLVALCTHNPRRAFLERAIAALRAQTLPVSSWDFLLVDNASTNGVPASIDLSWHPSGSHVLETTLGLIAARLRVFAEAEALKAGILLFVDDDTILAPDFLEIGLGLGVRDPRLGCWGGQLLPEYEVAPPDWFPPFAKYLAIFPLCADLVTEQFKGNHDCLPAGAGMFVRLDLACDYREMAHRDPLRLALGEQGKNGMRGEDTDLALYILDRGFRVGRFKALTLTHIMPKERLTLDYMSKLIAGIRAGTLLIDHLRGQIVPPRPGLLTRLRQRWQCARLPEVQSRLFAAELAGEERARALIAHTPPYCMTASLVSIVIPAYRAAGYLEATLASVAAQTWRNWELLVFEDGVFDNTAEIVRSLARNTTNRVELIQSAENRGVSHARNTLMDRAHGDYIAFLDADDIWDADHLESLVQTLRSSGAALTFSLVRYIDADGKSLGTQEPIGEALLADPAAGLYAYGFIQAASVFLIEQKWFNEGVRYDETLAYYEDLDLWLEILRRGGRFACTQRVTCGYRKHGASAMSKTIAMCEGGGDFYRKHIGDPLVPVFMRRRWLFGARYTLARMLWRTNPKRALAAMGDCIAIAPFNPKVYFWWLMAGLTYLISKRKALIQT